MNRSFWLLKAVKFIAMVALFATALTFATVALWNWLVPVLFHGPVLTFWQALGLLVLSRILLGGFGRGGGGFARGRAWKRRMEQRMSSLSPEQREQFRQQMRTRCASAWGMRPPVPSEPAAN